MKKIFSIFALSLVLLPALSFAADFRTEMVSRGDNVRNLYIAGQTVNVDANVGGDLNAAGNVINVNGNIERSAQLAGSSINLRGNVGGNARVAGGTINVDGIIGEDLVVFGGQITVGPNAIITHDIVVMGGTVTVNGKVNGKIVGNAGETTLNGTVAGDVDLKNAGKITLGSNAVINGKLIYGATERSNINESQVRGGVEFKQIDRNMAANRGKNAFATFSLFSLIGGFLLLLLLTRLAPKTTERFLGTAFINPWVNVGVGFITLVVAPIALVFLLISVVGIPIAGFGLLLYILLMALAGLLSGLLVGSWLYKTFTKKDVYEFDWLPILLGAIAVTLLKLVPVIGWLILFLLFLLALGGLTRMIFDTSTAQRKS